MSTTKVIHAEIDIGNETASPNKYDKLEAQNPTNSSFYIYI
jgi:hypothetical protein